MIESMHGEIIEAENEYKNSLLGNDKVAKAAAYVHLVDMQNAAGVLGGSNPTYPNIPAMDPKYQAAKELFSGRSL